MKLKWWKKMEAFQDWHGEYERGINGEDNEQSQKFKGKTENF